MKSNLATNARIDDELFGFTTPLKAKYDEPNVPLEDQISLTSTTSALTGGAYTGSDVIKTFNSQYVTVTGATSTATFTPQEARNMIGRETRLGVVSTGAGINLVLVLPAGWNWLYQGAAVALNTTSMTFPANTCSSISLTWLKNNRVLVTGNVTGYVFA